MTAVHRTIAVTWPGLFLAGGLFIATRLYLLCGFQPLGSDIFVHFRYAFQVVDLGHTPYREGARIEYPPLAWWMAYCLRTAIPHQLADKDDRVQVNRLYWSFNRKFRGRMFVCDIVSLILLLLVVRRRAPGRVAWAMILYTLTTTGLPHLLYDRLDIGLLMFVMIWAYCWTRALDNSRWCDLWTAAAYFGLGLAISFKMIPVICVPFLLLAELYAPRRLGRLVICTAMLLASAAGPFLMQYAWSGADVFYCLQYHGERGIQIESLYATLLQLAFYAGASVKVAYSHGGYIMTGELAQIMKTASTMVLFTFLALMGCCALARGRRYSRQDAYRLCCFVLAASLIFAKVLSPQFFLLGLPVIILLTAELMPTRRHAPWVLGACLVVVAMITTWIYPYHYGSSLGQDGLVPIEYKRGHFASALSPSPWPYIVLGIRNVFFLGIIAWLGRTVVTSMWRGNPDSAAEILPMSTESCDSGDCLPIARAA